jgi:glycine/D-amino acid oxidase-like deaminating enzyme
MNIIVVGAGIAGLSTAWSLVKAGHSVTLLEQGASIPNPLAASGDHHRIIRRAYRASTGYGALITEAYDAWSELWRDLGQNHLDPRGFICVSREPGDEAEEYREGMEAGGWPIEMFDPDAAVKRWPFWSRAASAMLIFRPTAARCTAARSPPGSPPGCAGAARTSIPTARSFRSTPTRAASNWKLERLCAATASSSLPAPGY